MSANVWELAAWRLVAQLALQGLPQWTAIACRTFTACIRGLWELEHPPIILANVQRLEGWFADLREYVPIGKLAEYDHLMQLATRFKDRVPPDGCPIGPTDEQITSLATMIDLNGVKGESR